MKAFKIKSDIVAAPDEQAALKEWIAEFGECRGGAGPVEELNPATYLVHYEQDDGSFEPGPLSHMMPNNEIPVVLIEGEYEP